jgi:hypothetical protein
VKLHGERSCFVAACQRGYPKEVEYQLLVEASADYGKESRAVLDWTDSDLLREMVRRRLIHNSLPSDTPFERVWSEICVSHYEGEETSQYLVDRSLMRPRNLIKLLAHCRGFAVGLEHARIEEADFKKGLRAYSLDLITEADQELTDILGEDTNLIYHFIGEGEEFDPPKLERVISGAGVPADKIVKVIEFMLYYGFLGVKTEDETTRYIFDLGYDMKLLNVFLITHYPQPSRHGTKQGHTAVSAGLNGAAVHLVSRHVPPHSEQGRHLQH